MTISEFLGNRNLSPVAHLSFVLTHTSTYFFHTYRVDGGRHKKIETSYMRNTDRVKLNINIDICCDWLAGKD